MRKMTSLAFISLVPAIVMGACASFQKSHLETLKAKHPFALLGDDFGVLNEGDLAWNACEAEPRAFSSDSISYPYWQCFESRSVTFLCDHSGTKAPEKPTDALIVLTVKGLELDQEYLARRPIDI